VKETDLSRADKSFDAVVGEYADMVTRLCCLNLNDTDQSEDCWQEVFLALHTHPSILDKTMPEIRKWLITVTLNKCRNLNKRLFYRRHENIDEMDIPSVDEQTGEVLDALRTLPRQYSRVIYLHYYEGYGVRELAALLGRNGNTVKSQLKRGREMLKGVLELESNN
jgi:RNA polymerase sigma factor (sigma-70 family)